MSGHSKARTVVGIVLAIWGSIRGVLDLLSSLGYAKEYAGYSYAQIVAAPSSRTLTVTVVVTGAVLLLFEPIKKWWQGEGADAEEKEENELRLRPSISGEILSIFWRKAKDKDGKPEPRNSDFHVKLKLVNHEDLPCSIDKYWLTITIGGHERRCLGMPSKTGTLLFQSPVDNTPVETEIYPLTVNYDTPLKLALAREGWVTFHVIECDMPPAPFWLMNIRLVVTDSLGNEHPIGSSSATVFPATIETAESNPEPILSLECGMTQVAYDSQNGVWTEHVKQDMHPSTAFLLHVLNSPPGIGVNDIRAQIEWTYETGVPGPSFCPAMWLDEPYGKVNLPIAWRKTLLVGIKTTLGYGVYGWTGYDNRRIDANERPNAHSELVPQRGTLLVKVIRDSGEVLFKATLGWKVDLYSFLPDVELLPSS
jgi:hypothetical protein